MKRIILIAFITILSLSFIQIIHAEVKLPAIVSSNMVLQRNSTIKLWGWADANERIKIKTSWSEGVLLFEADDDGNWLIEVKTTNSKKPQTIEITSKSSKILLENILFGEVWLCSGQSNMTRSLKGTYGDPIFSSNMAIAKSANPNLRLFTVGKVGSKTPLNDIAKHSIWQQASPENVSDFSAVAYFFGQQLQQILDVPVGLIHASWGGSMIQAWMSNEALSRYQGIDFNKIDITKNTNHIPTVLFNSMINPLTSYTIKGVLWYQGESNRNEPDHYKKLFPAMVKDWRDRWGIGDFPFYFVQIAPYIYGGNNTFQSTQNSAFMREAQLQCLDSIPNSSIAITIDIGNKDRIHPPQKKEVADRLLFNALNQTYGYKTVDNVGPVFTAQEMKNGGIILKFTNAETGLYSYDKLEGFEISSDDKVFYPANAEIVNLNEVFVKSDKVPNPVAVRYAWNNWVIGTLYDVNLLPSSSFRTDNWKDATRFEENHD